MKFLVDEDLPTAVIALLTELGHEAIHARDAGLGGQPDRQIFGVRGRGLHFIQYL